MYLSWRLIKTQLCKSNKTKGVSCRRALYSKKLLTESQPFHVYGIMGQGPSSMTSSWWHKVSYSQSERGQHGFESSLADNCSCSLNIDGQNQLQLFWCPLVQSLLGAQRSPRSLKASSWDCMSHRVSTARDGAAVMAAVWSSCSWLSPSDSNYSICKTVRGNVDWTHPPWSGTMKPCVRVILQQEVLVRNMELTSHRQLEEFGKGQKETPHVLPASQNPPHWDHSWLSNAQATRKNPKSGWLAGDKLETNPMTIKPETAGHMAEQSSWAPWPSCSLLRHPFPTKSLA